MDLKILLQLFVVQKKHTKELFRIMRLTTVLLFVGVFQLLAINTTTKAQNITININANVLSVGQLLDQIEHQSDYLVVFRNKEVDTNRAVSFPKKSAKLETYLDEAFRGTDITYSIDNKYILLYKKSEKKESASVAQQEGKRITGTITDKNGEPIIGANIVEKGTTNGTISDVNGKFTLNISQNSSLQVSFIGYVTQEFSAKNQKNFNIRLMEDTQNLQEVVVVGYGTMKKSDFTGAVSSANLSAFKESQNVNVIQSLKGSVPGLQISQTNQAGQDVSIQVRGVNTLTSNTSPLIVVDGIIFSGSLNDLNPSDIKSIDVLKDASSKAIYGSQAANGVILITTNSGKISDKPTVRYSGSVSFQSPTKNYRLLNAQEDIEKIKGIYYDKAYLSPDYTTPNPSFTYNQTELVPSLLTGIENGVDFDWWKALTRNAFSTNHSVSLSGGTGKTSYYMSGGFTKVDGMIKNDNYKRYTTRINLNNEFKNWLSIGINAFGSFSDYSGVSPSFTNISLSSPFVTPYNESGELEIYPKGASTTHLNPFLDMQSDNKDISDRISAIFYGEIKVPWIQGLKYRVNYNQSYNWTDYNNSNVYGASLTGAASKYHTNFHEETLDNIVSYDNKLGDHSINATFVYGYRKANYDTSTASGEQYSNLVLSYNSLQQAVIQHITSSAWKESQLYQMGRINYNYKNRYLLTGTVRRDGYSGFSSDHKFAVFPSAALGWTISNEPFFKIKQIDNLKLRASYGENGNQTSRYSSLARVSALTDYQYTFGDGASTSIGQAITSLSNNSLKWEKTKGFNFGMDFSVLNSKIKGSLEYYTTKTNNLLWDRVIPEVTGFSSIRSNVGEIQNHGFEFNVLVNPITTKDFSWSFNVNFSANRNKITHLLGDSNGDGKEDDLISSNLFIGKSIGAIYSYKVNGIYQIGDDIPTGYNPGNYRIVDMDGKDGISADDRTFLGKTEPSYMMGFQNNLNYKNFSFKFFINTIQGGHDGYLGEQSFTMYNSTGNLANANNFTYEDYWSVNNPNAKYSQNYKMAKIMASRYQSRSFIRLQDISLSYRFNKSLIDFLGIGALEVYVSGKNLFTITNWDGWDPETNQGIGTWDAHPVMKSFNIGLDVSF